MWDCRKVQESKKELKGKVLKLVGDGNHRWDYVLNEPPDGSGPDSRRWARAIMAGGIPIEWKDKLRFRYGAHAKKVALVEREK